MHYIFFWIPMDQITGINLPQPSPATRQVGVSLMGSPISLSRSTSSLSNQSDIRSPEEILRDNLLAYIIFLEHEIEFVDAEITALLERPSSNDPNVDTAFLRLREGLKIRYNKLQQRLSRARALLDTF
jgi:hypothetical protein